MFYHFIEDKILYRSGYFFLSKGLRKENEVHKNMCSAIFPFFQFFDEYKYLFFILGKIVKLSVLDMNELEKKKNALTYFATALENIPHL